MAPKRCKTCGGTDGAHYAICFGARLFERVMGKGFPLFPPGVLARRDVTTDVERAVRRVIEHDGTLGEAQRAARKAGGRLEVSLEPLPAEHLTALREVAALHEQIDAEHRAALRYRTEVDTEREARERAERERDELQALLDAATKPEPDEELNPVAVAAVKAAEEFIPSPEPPAYWWNSPLGREARASVALDGETHVVGEPARPEDIAEVEARFGQTVEDPMPTVEQLAEAEEREPDVVSPASGALDEADVEALEEAAAELAEKADPAEIQEIEDQFTEAARRRAWMDEKRAELRQMINATEGLNQKALADGAGLNQGTVSAVLNGKVYGPTSEQQLQRMLQVAENFTNPPQVEPRGAEQPRSVGAPAQVKNSDSWRAAERFLAEATEHAEADDAFVTAPELQAAYESWRGAHEDVPAVHPMTLGQVTVASGFARIRKNVSGKQQRAYGGMRLKVLATAGAPNEGRGGGDEAPQDSDGEPNAVAPATFSEAPEYLHGTPERYTRDDVPELLQQVHESGRTVMSVMSGYLAGEVTLGTGSPIVAGDPAGYVRHSAPSVKVVEHPPGWDELPGKELKNTEIRAMAILLRKEQGWGYKRSHGRGGKPKLRTPNGRIFALTQTPEDFRSAKNTRAQLRRLGADL